MPQYLIKSAIQWPIRKGRKVAQIYSVYTQSILYATRIYMRNVCKLHWHLGWGRAPHILAAVAPNPRPPVVLIPPPPTPRGCRVGNITFSQIFRKTLNFVNSKIMYIHKFFLHKHYFSPKKNLRKKSKLFLTLGVDAGTARKYMMVSCWGPHTQLPQPYSTIYCTNHTANLIDWMTHICMRQIRTQQ